MKKILTGLKQGLSMVSIKSYADPNYDASTMRIMRRHIYDETKLNSRG